jgi:hypothetical protein
MSASGAFLYSWFSSTPIPNFPVNGPSVYARVSASTCFTVVGSTSVCSGSTTVCVTVIPQFTINISPQNPYVCPNSSVNISLSHIGAGATGPPSAFNYSWTEMFTSTINNNLSQTVTCSPTTDMSYTVQVIDANKCVSAPHEFTVVVSECNGLPSEGETTLTIFPTLADRSLKIVGREQGTVRILDMSGVIITSVQATASEVTLDVSELKPGIYFLTFENHYGTKSSQRILITR